MGILLGGAPASAMLRDEDRWNKEHTDAATAVTYVQGWIAERAAWITANL